MNKKTGDIEKDRQACLKQTREQFPKYVSNLEKVYYGKKSFIRAIKAKCLDCCCWQREEVRNCQSYACPLWNLRPFQSNEEAESEE